MIGEKKILWVEEFRPKTVKDCILPDRLKKTFQEYVDRKEVPNLILSGSPGTGKTTVAMAMCEEIGLDYILLNGSEENGIDTMRVKVKGFASSVSLTGGRKVIIFDEADYLTPLAQAALRGVIEEFAGNCSFIFTCNLLNRLIEPLHSRTAVINFKLTGAEKSGMASQFFKRVEYILNFKNIAYDSKVVAEVVMKFFPDYRRILNELQKHSVSGPIDASVLAQVGDVSLTELFVSLRAKDFKSIRKWVGTHTDSDSQKIMRDIYDKLSEYVAPQSIPAAVVLLGRYQYQAAFVVDQEINLMAFLTELLVECEFR